MEQMSFGSQRDTLKEARELVQRGRESGIECPCCGQFYKVYRRKFNSGMARILIWLVKVYKGEWVDVAGTAPVFVRRSNEVSRLVKWGMAVEKFQVPDEKRNSGFYMPTELGVAFAQRKMKVSSHMVVCNNVVEGFDGEEVDIVDVLGRKFNYAELMSA